MDFSVPDISAFYNKDVDSNILFQGDIIQANKIGLKDESNPSPDYWMIITKSCDLVFRDGKAFKVKNDQFTLLALTSIRQYFHVIRNKVRLKMENESKKIVMLGLINLSKATNSIVESGKISEIIEEKITKFTYLPPDGNVLKEPMIIDYDLIQILNGDFAKDMLSGKIQQLSSPFREKVAQRFALHYMSIAIDDEHIRQKAYKKAVADYYAKKD